MESTRLFGIVEHREADEQASRWGDSLSFLVGGSQVCSHLNSSRISDVSIVLCGKSFSDGGGNFAFGGGIYLSW